MKSGIVDEMLVNIIVDALNTWKSLHTLMPQCVINW